MCPGREIHVIPSTVRETSKRHLSRVQCLKLKLLLPDPARYTWLGSSLKTHFIEGAETVKQVYNLHLLVNSTDDLPSL